MLLVTIGAIDSTQVAMSNICLRFAEDPNLQEVLRGTDRETRAAALDEFLRLDTPIPLVGRAGRCVEIVN
jgi:cytochrome P450